MLIDCYSLLSDPVPDHVLSVVTQTILAATHDN